MSFTDAPSIWRGIAANAFDNFPRLIMLLVITLGWALTLAWPPPMRDARPLVEIVDGKPQGYPLRVALPEAAPLTEEEVSRLIEEHGALAKVDPQDLPERPAEFQKGTSRTGRNSAAFNDAFRDLVKRPEPRPGEILAVNYDLAELTPVKADVDPSDGSLTVQKPLFVNGVSAGAATIRIESGAQILIATSSVAKALGDRADALPRRISGALAKGSGFIPFYELRSAGIQVEYDAARDRVSLSMPS